MVMAEKMKREGGKDFVQKHLPTFFPTASNTSHPFFLLLSSFSPSFFLFLSFFLSFVTGKRHEQRLQVQMQTSEL